MTAKEARKMAEEPYKNRVAQEVEELLEVIKLRAENGYLHYDYVGYMSIDVQTRLESLGYRLTDNNNKIHISWR